MPDNIWSFIVSYLGFYNPIYGFEDDNDVYDDDDDDNDNDDDGDNVYDDCDDDDNDNI